ncbi:MAG: thioredoxin domain-containing protein [Polyangiaceae bacterium]|nr:thioredoxin domain-containing protein [Polyangiaceae bacterium]
MASANRLANETSPYLLQHAHNPVDWHPWGKEALEKAQREDKPIFLSIGYAACHWCHVMERESFEDEEVARVLNDKFISIKVDREERPDIDAIYMTATVAMSGSGGWPMSVFLTPEQKPFFAGTYFPKSSRYGRPGFLQLLEKISEVWSKDRAQLARQADELTGAVAAEAAKETPRGIEAEAEDKAVAQLARSFDPEWGGFGNAPKFPAPFALSTLLRHHAKAGDDLSLKMVKVTLDRMFRGGMYDHIGGGFARYSTDERWLVPHFEKMLYDNAQLARVYVEAWQVTGDPELRAVATETLDYILREMQGAHGGYFSATDADSEGVEGKFFVWTLREIEDLLGEADAAVFAAAYDITEEGNWEGHNIAWQPEPLADVAKGLGKSLDDVRAVIARSKPILYEARKKRVPPLLDDKVLASWNGLMIGTMAFAGRVLGEARWIESAKRAAAAVLGRLARPDGGLYRTFRAGKNGEEKAHIDGFLEDYAFMADALVDLFESTGEREHLSSAVRLAERMILDFGGEEDEGFFTTSKSGEALVVRMHEGQDNATPSANAVAARALVRLAAHADRDDLRDIAERAIRAHGRGIARQPRAFLTSLDVVSRSVTPPIEVAIVGSPDDPGLAALEAALARRYVPGLVLAKLDPKSERRSLPHPLLEGKTLVDGKAAVYVCRNYACSLPVTTPEALNGELDAALGRAKTEQKGGLSAAALPGRATAASARALLDRAKIAAELTTTIGDVPVHRAGVLIASYREAEAATLLTAAASRGRNLIAFDPERAEALGDTLPRLAETGTGRDALFLVLAATEEIDPKGLGAALGRARVASVDLVLLPATADGIDGARTAAKALVASGLAHAAGLSFADPVDTSLAKSLGNADGSVSFIAAPLNLLEGDAAPVASLADAGWSMLATRPLDGRAGPRTVHLVDPATMIQPPPGPPLAAAVAELAALEEEYRKTIAIHLRAEGADIDPNELLTWSRELGRAEAALDDLAEVEAFVAQSVAPVIGAQLGALSGIGGPLAERVASLRDRYVEAVDKGVQALARKVASRQAAFAMTAGKAASPADPAKAGLVALGAVLGAKGVTAALVTHRRSEELERGATWDLAAPALAEIGAAVRKAMPKS